MSDTNVVTFTRLNRRANGGQCGFQVLEYLHRPGTLKLPLCIIFECRL